MSNSISRLLPLLLLSSCVTIPAPHWFQKQEERFIYRGWLFTITDANTVAQACGGISSVGCTLPNTLTVWTVNNPYVLAHECEHVDALEDGGSSFTEQLKDFILGIFGLNDVLVYSSWIMRATPYCGEDKPARLGKWDMIPKSFPNEPEIPVCEEWLAVKVDPESGRGGYDMICTKFADPLLKYDWSPIEQDVTSNRRKMKFSIYRIERHDTRIVDSHSTSNGKKVQANFFALPLLCQEIWPQQFESIQD